MTAPELRVLSHAIEQRDGIQERAEHWLADLDLENVDEWRWGFEVARRVRRAVVDCGSDPANVDPMEFLPCLTQWAHRNEIDEDILILAYQTAWEIVRTPHGMGLLDEGFIKAKNYLKHNPLHLNFRAPTPKLQRLADLLYLTIGFVQLGTDDPAFLSARKAGELLGIDATHAARILKRLVKSGDLIVVAERTTRSATRYKTRGKKRK